MNCKPGDIAEFITGHNKGRRVVVMRAALLGDDLPGAGDLGSWACWVIQPLQQLVAVDIDGFAEELSVTTQAIARDAALRPVPGDELLADVTEEVTA